MKQEKNTGLLVYNQYLRRKRIALVAALIVTLAAALYSLGIGSIPISLPDIFAVLTGGGEKMQRTAIMNIRLPRAVTAILVGSALAAAGAVMQCVLRNRWPRRPHWASRRARRSARRSGLWSLAAAS